MSVPLVTVPYLASVIVLAGAGLFKLAQPSDTARALAGAGLPARRSLVRAGAGVELGVALLALLWSGRLGGVLVAASYTAFTVFVVAAVNRGWPLSSCGCFGKQDSRPSYVHAALDAGAAACAIMWAVSDPGSLRSVLASGTSVGISQAVVAIVVAGLAYAVWTRPLQAGVA
jgi:hypothetical protein